jgi:HlyD family secretion protein
MAKSRSLTRWVILLIIVGVSASLAYLYWKRRAEPTPVFASVKLSRGEIVQSVTATGDLQPVTTVDVSSQISGLISAVLVDYNTPVKKGDLLARIDPATYESRLTQARAQLANTRANHTLVALNAARTRALRTQQLVSQQELDQAEAVLSQAEAQLQIQQATVDNAQVDLARCNILAPIDGIVMDRLVDVGKTVAASLNAPTLFTLAADLTQMQIKAAVAEGDIGAVAVEQPVTFVVDAFPNRQFRGRVRQIRSAPTNQQSVITYATIIAVQNDDLKLRPGMTANVSIIIDRRDEETLRLLNSALRVRIPESLLPATEKSTGSPASKTASREEIQQLMVEAGLDPANRRMAPEARARVIQLAKARGLELPERFTRAGREDSSAPITRTVYKLAGSTDAPRVEPVIVKLGITDGSATEVIEGLSEGDTIITSVTLPNAKNAASPAASPFGGGGGVQPGRR